jgi:hypothetical protein
MGEAGKRHVAQLLDDGVAAALAGILAGAGFVAKALDTTRADMRGCMCQKRAPVPGPCQAAAAEKPGGPRIVGYSGQTDVYLVMRVDWRRSMDTLNMALEGVVGAVDDSFSVFRWPTVKSYQVGLGS